MSDEPIIVSYSELDTYRQCPLKHELLYRKRYTKPAKETSALAKGSLFHVVMEEHYRVIKAWQDDHKGKVAIRAEKQVLELARTAVLPFLVDLKTGEQSDNQQLVEWMYDGYVEKWGADLQWRIMGVEHQIITPLRDEKGNRSIYHLKAKMDLLVRDREANDTFWVVDHKSGANLPNQMDLEIDDQFGLYTWAMNEVGKRVTGSIHNAARTTRNKGDFPDAGPKYSPQTLEQRHSRTHLNRSDKEIKNLALDAYKVAWNAYPPKGKGPKLYSSPDPRQCGWKCDVKEPHLLMRQGRNPHEVMTEYGFKIDRTRH